MADEWRPGSFTKNYSWGPLSDGLKRLHEAINVGFDGQLAPVSRSEFRRRVSRLKRPDFIPLNFFLYNRIQEEGDVIVVDELVFQALTSAHSGQFDKLGLYAFNLSNVGRWRGAKSFQARPALWSKEYLIEQIGRKYCWNAALVNADDIENFVESDVRYGGDTTRKLATNLNHLFRAGRIKEYNTKFPERWWLSAIFLTLDRFSESEKLGFDAQVEARLSSKLINEDFWEMSGPRSKAKEIAAAYFVTLYAACGGIERFSHDSIAERHAVFLPAYRGNHPPENGAVGVFHPSNPAASNVIPHACRVLARLLAGFEVMEISELEGLDIEKYVQTRTAAALKALKEGGVKPNLSGDELTKLTRGE